MTTTDPVLARIDAEILKMADFFDSADDIYTAQSVVDEENSHLRFILALKSAVERHGPEVRYVVSEDGGSFDSEQEARDSCDDGDVAEIKTFILCSGCAEINNSAMEDADEWTYLPEVYFPCPEYTDIAEKLGVVL